MDYLELISESFFTLSVNKLRTGLATLGIVIGIGSVISLISLGQGSQKAVESQIQSLGSNLLTITPSAQNNGGVRSAVGSAASLTLDDAKAISSSPQITTVAAVSPEYQSRSQVTAQRNNTNTQIIGVEPQYQTIRNLTLAAGNFITDRDNSAITKVAVIGSQVATDLFGQEISPIGQTIRINNQSLVVIGVLTSKGGSGFNNPDDAIYIPLSTAQKQLFGSDNISSISVQAKSTEVMEQARDEVGYLLLSRHKIKDPLEADFMIFSQNDILSTVSQVTSTFTTLLGGIAAISLVVGGIGIMNIMLVTVTERTREIGLKKALGAKKKDITTGFLVEACILTLLGGTIGMLLGVCVSFLLSKVMGSVFTVSLQSIVLSLTVSGGIGVLFGWYPAKKAADLQPIEALRYE